MEMESPRSPEAEIGHRVEDLWEVAEPQLSPSEKLNSCFEDITVASFHRPLGSQDALKKNLSPVRKRRTFLDFLILYANMSLAGIHGDIYASPRDHICASLHNWALPIADPLFKTRSEIGVGLFSSDFDESDDPGQGFREVIIVLIFYLEFFYKYLFKLKDFDKGSYNKDMIWWSTEGTIIQCCLQTVLFFTPGVWLDII
uniref:OSJNBb0089B03.9 protein n=1 Tax=Oryza sativa subsp. japonica TaxID=39947 RepID=Q7XNQ2_ORYSJ|nr:OSJNBb0089B03.9 [Oryza sativa Japonica Group]